MSLFKNNSEISLYSRLNTMSNSSQVFEYSTIQVYKSKIGFYNSWFVIDRFHYAYANIDEIGVSMLVFGQIQIRLEISITVNSILGFQFEPWLNLGTSVWKSTLRQTSNWDPDSPKFARDRPTSGLILEGNPVSVIQQSTSLVPNQCSRKTFSCGFYLLG